MDPPETCGSPRVAEEIEEEKPLDLSFAGAWAELDCQPEELSKFEKYGQKYITDRLRHLFHQMTAEKRLKVVPEAILETYQIEAVLAVHRHFNTPKSALDLEGDSPLLKKALIIAPPGSGKSGMVTLIPYVLLSKKVLIVTPSKIISEQLAADFGYPDPRTKRSSPFFMKCGMFQKPCHLKLLLEPVHLATTQKDVDNITASNLVIVNAQKFGGRSTNSLGSNSGRSPEEREQVVRQLQEFDTIIVDEAHHYPAKTWVDIVHLFEGKKVIFLTATPYRGHAHMHDLLKSSVEQVFEIDSEVLEGKTIRPTEFVERTAIVEDIADPQFLEQLISDINELLSKHDAQEIRAPPHQAMILVRTRAEAEQVAQGLGDTATFVISDSNGNENLQNFTLGRKRIVVVCGMLREGYDNPNVSLVVILRKCQSRVLFEQFCGRCMRVHRNLTGKDIDNTVGTVLSYQHFNQGEMWAKRLKYSDQNPVEEDAEEKGQDEFRVGVWL